MALKLLKAGKHSCLGHLSSPAAADSPGGVHFERPAMLVYVGQFDSQDGEVEVEEADIDRIVENFNASREAILAHAAGDEAHFVRSMPPLQLDHSTDARRTIGRVLGVMSKGPYTLKDGRTVPALFNDRIRVLGADNIEKTKDGRYGPVSVGADFAPGILSELSVVAFPAAEGASLLAKSRKLSEGDPMHEKLKKHLMEAKQMSAEQADEHLGKLKEHLKKHLGYDDEGAAKHLEAMEPEGAEKMSAAMSAGEGEHLSEEEKEAPKKLAAAKLEIAKLSKGLAKEIKETRLAARTSSIRARLSRLQASAKITPAERKKHDMAKLAAMGDESLEAVLKTYEDREPVIDARVHGTSKAVNLAKLQKDSAKARLAAETKQDLGMPLDEKEKKALEGHAEGPQQPEGVPGTQDEHLKHLQTLIGDHPHKEAILAHVAKMMEHPAVMAAEETGQDEKHLSGLVENVNKLHTQFDGLVKLFGDATGLSAAELTE